MFSREWLTARHSRQSKEKYQAYLLNEVTLEIAGQTLKPALTASVFSPAENLW